MKQQIPAFVEELYEFLKKEVTWLHGRWIIFEQLYNKSPLRIDLLNEAADSFFYVLQFMMLDDVQLSLGRLTDPAPGKASLLQLQKRLESHANAGLAANAKKALAELMQSVEPIRTRRDKLIAHYSLEQATKQHAEQLPDIYYRDLNESLRLVRDYMNLIEHHYHDTVQGYEHFILQSDGDSLVTVLKWGLRYRDHLLAQKVHLEPKDKWSDA
jgi:hypothetical protein